MKLITTAAGIALALTLGLTQVSGTAVRGNARPMMGQGKCRQVCFVDKDSDGICDNRGSGNFVDADGDGICDNRGSGCNGINRGNGGNRCGQGKKCR